MKLPFDRLVHSDWSVSERSRATAIAERSGDGWHVAEPRPTGDLRAFQDTLFDPSRTVLAGFDFPIGLPHAYARVAGLSGFVAALDVFGTGIWSRFFDVCATLGEVSPQRPFYPNGHAAGPIREDLAGALGVDAFDDLHRRVERAVPGARNAASCLFLTLGAGQVGKAAGHGWRHVLQPARRAGARLWPFEGTLVTLAAAGIPVLAETYPGEAYRHVGIDFRRGGPRRSKGDRDDRRFACSGIHDHVAARQIRLDPALSRQIADGFGEAPGGDDRLDALAGLFHMIEVVDGRLHEAPPDIDRTLEGWILGQQS